MVAKLAYSQEFVYILCNILKTVRSIFIEFNIGAVCKIIDSLVRIGQEVMDASCEDEHVFLYTPESKLLNYYWSRKLFEQKLYRKMKYVFVILFYVLHIIK
jgi:hypothetical protein